MQMRRITALLLQTCECDTTFDVTTRQSLTCAAQRIKHVLHLVDFHLCVNVHLSPSSCPVLMCVCLSRRAALQIDASNTNANRYLKAVEERAKQAGVSLEASPPPLPPSTNQPPSTHDNTHAARHDSTHAARHDSIHAARHDQREGVHQGVERGRQQGGCEARGPKDGDGGRSERSAQKRRRSGERGSGSDTHTSSDESSSESGT